MGPPHDDCGGGSGGELRGGGGGKDNLTRSLVFCCVANSYEPWSLLVRKRILTKTWIPQHCPKAMCLSPGRCFNFHFGRGGGGPPPWLTSLPPLDPLPPSPVHSNSPENQGFGNVFSFGPILPSRAFGALIAGFFGYSTVSFHPSVADTMSQHPISAFFGTRSNRVPA